jgi:hypothetical protein
MDSKGEVFSGVGAISKLLFTKILFFLTFSLDKKNIGCPYLSSYPPMEGKLLRGFEGLDVGDRVRVEFIGTDVERGFIDFRRAGRGQGD